jgi:hypothetical protein
VICHRSIPLEEEQTVEQGKKDCHSTRLFDAPDAHFDYLSLFSGIQAEKVGNPPQKL